MESDPDCFNSKSIQDEHFGFMEQTLWDIFGKSDVLGQDFLNNCAYVYDQAEKFMLWNSGSLACDYSEYYDSIQSKIKCDDIVQESIDHSIIVLGFISGSAYDRYYTETRCRNENDYRKCQLEVFKNCKFQEKQIRKTKMGDRVQLKDWEEAIRNNVPGFRFSNCPFTIGHTFEELAPLLGYENPESYNSNSTDKTDTTDFKLLSSESTNHGLRKRSVLNHNNPNH